MIQFIVWVVVGGFVALTYAIYEMVWLSPRGEDKVSKIRNNK